MLVVKRHPGQRMFVPTIQMWIHVLGITPQGEVKLGFESPSAHRVYREEMTNAIAAASLPPPSDRTP